MDENSRPENPVKNVFRNGRMPTREEYTQFWIRMINRIEREKADRGEA